MTLTRDGDLGEFSGGGLELKVGGTWKWKHCRRDRAVGRVSEDRPDGRVSEDRPVGRVSEDRPVSSP